MRSLVIIRGFPTWLTRLCEATARLRYSRKAVCVWWASHHPFGVSCPRLPPDPHQEASDWAVDRGGTSGSA